MDSGVYTSAAGMMTGFNAENNIADNLSNMQTPGFKERLPVLQSFSQQLLSAESGYGTLPGQSATDIGTLGQAPQIRNYGLDLAQGSPKPTGQPFDLMLVGNAFFSVHAGNKTLLTRNGSFHRAADSSLVTSDGYQVLNAAGQPLKIPQGTITIDRTGGLLVNGKSVDRLGLASVPVGAPLTDSGSGYYVGPGTALPARAPGVAVLQGYLEGSNVDLAGQTSAMMAYQRSYQQNSKMLQIQDDMLGLAVNDLGKVSG